MTRRGVVDGHPQLAFCRSAVAAYLALLVTAAVAASLVSGASAQVERSASSTAASAYCPRYVVLASRGSGEDNLYSVPGSQLITWLRAKLGGSPNVKAVPNTYPAVGSLSATVGGYLKLPAAYHNSVVTGRIWLRSQLHVWQERCAGKTRLILTGYSQGAQVTGDVVQEPGLVTGELKNMLLGVVLFGDPYFNGSDARADRGDYRRGLDGVLASPKPRPRFRSDLTVLSYCHDHDAICQLMSAADVARYQFTRHSNYGTLNEPEGAAELLAEIANGLGPDQHQVARVQGKTITVTRGPITVRFDWSAMDPQTGMGRRLTVERNGVVAYRGEPRTASSCAHGCLAGFDVRHPEHFIQIAQLDSDPEPEIAIIQYEGPGSRCCATLLLLDWTAHGYWRTEENFYSADVELIDPDKDGHLRIASAVAAFTYEYACGDCSRLPLVIYSLSSVRHQLVDSTCRYPALLEAESRKLLAEFRAIRPGSSASGLVARGTAAPWAADQVRLGRGAQAFAQLDAWALAGKFDLSPPDSVYGTAAQFIAKLRTDLPRFGIRPC